MLSLKSMTRQPSNDATCTLRPTRPRSCLITSCTHTTLHALYAAPAARLRLAATSFCCCSTQQHDFILKHFSSALRRHLLLTQCPVHVIAQLQEVLLLSSAAPAVPSLQ